MPDCMMPFPEDWHDFLKDYSFDDSEEVYTNGSRLIPVFRVEQLIKHILKAQEPAQEPRVMKVGDVRKWVNSDRVTREQVVIEIRGGVCAWIIDDEVREIPDDANLSSDLYGKTWRCWTSRPTDEQREAVKWE